MDTKDQSPTPPTGSSHDRMSGVRPSVADVDVAELERFIVRAKSRTYVSGGGRADASRPGSHDLVFEEGAWTYRDSYLGGTDFLGQEVVWHQGVPVWAMNYYGWISDDDAITAAVAGRVVMGALSALYAEGRFLGGHEAEVAGWEYRDTSAGDVRHFEGREQISRPGSEEVYALVYHGGLVRTVNA